MPRISFKLAAERGQFCSEWHGEVRFPDSLLYGRKEMRVPRVSAILRYDFSKQSLKIELTALIFLASIKTAAQREHGEVTILFSVNDKFGRVVADIKKEDIQIREDGILRPIAKFQSAADMPIVMEVLIDASESMKRNQDIVSATAKQFLGLTIKSGRDMAAVSSFGRSVVLEQSATDDLAKLRAAIDRAAARADERSMPLYAELVEAANRLATVPGRRMILVTTDYFINSGQVSRAKAIEALQRADVSVCGIFAARDDVGEMNKLIRETGGFTYVPDFPRNIADIESQLRQLARQISSQHLVTFQSSPAKKPDALRQIQIKTVRRDLKDGSFAYRQRY